MSNHPSNPFVTVGLVAEATGLTRSTIQYHIDRGQLDATLVESGRGQQRIVRYRTAREWAEKHGHRWVDLKGLGS